PGTFLLEDAVGRECRAAHRQFHERRNQSVRPGAYRDGRSGVRCDVDPGRRCTHVYVARSFGDGGGAPPHGAISGDVTVAGRTFKQAANGFGDPMMEFDLNVIGPKAQRNIPDALRYEPGFSVD